MGRRIALLAAGLAVSAATWIGLQAVAGASEWCPPLIPHEVVSAYVLVLLGAPIAFGWLTMRALARRWTRGAGRPRLTVPRSVVWVLVVGYALTTMVGIPAAQSHRDAWAVAEYKRIRASGSKRVWEGHPYVRTYLTIPVLPCVILSYHEYQLDGLYGLGSFEVALWYGVGVSTADVWPLWIS